MRTKVVQLRLRKPVSRDVGRRALSTRLAGAGGLPGSPRGPWPPCVAIVQAQLRAAARPAAACRRAGRRARCAPAEPWARRAFPGLSPGWSPPCARQASSASVTRGLGALTHLADLPSLTLLTPSSSHSRPPRPSQLCQQVPLRPTQRAHWSSRHALSP